MSKTRRVIYSPQAKDDLREIAAYIIHQLQNPAAAKRITAAIRSEIRSLSRMSERYEAVDWEPWASMQMRKFPVGSFVVFYLVDDATVSITRILYGGRDIEHMVQDEGEE